jgi:hypothetical protein
MKINIGPYINWTGPYQIADLLQKVGVSEERCFAIGERMPNWINEVCLWVESKRHRRLKIQIDSYDTWSMDHTLALIIVPLLQQLRNTTHGYPANLCSSGYSGQVHFKGEGFEYPEDHGAGKWDAILAEMIWAFEQASADDWKNQYYSGVSDIQWVETTAESDDKGNKFSELIYGPNHTVKIDQIGMAAHAKRMQDGFDLFAKYYTSLWD